MENLLEVVNEEDEVIGLATREEIHRAGLLHREICVCFFTPNKELIFQHRSKSKDTSPDLLGATVGGHVEAGESYEETAIKETLEETGVQLRPEDLIFIKKTKDLHPSLPGNKANCVFRSRFLYIFRGPLSDLKVEEGEGLGFESWPLEKLFKLTEAERSRFTSGILKFTTEDLAAFIKDLNF